MRRLARILLNCLTVVSLILLIATIWLWVRSYQRADYLYWFESQRPQTSRFEVRLFSGLGGVTFLARSWKPSFAHTYEAGGWRQMGGRDWDVPQYAGGGATKGRAANRFGFAFERRPDDSLGPFVRIVTPVWLLASVFAAIPLARLAARLAPIARGIWVRERGLCPGCGYDLRATPDRCPECGAAHRLPKGLGDPRAGSSGM